MQSLVVQQAFISFSHSLRSCVLAPMPKQIIFILNSKKVIFWKSCWHNLMKLQAIHNCLNILPANSAFSILFNNFDACLMTAWHIFPFMCLTVMVRMIMTIWAISYNLKSTKQPKMYQTVYLISLNWLPKAIAAHFQVLLTKFETLVSCNAEMYG